MKNKQHEYILRAFLESAIPAIIRSRAPELITVDSILGGYSTQLLQETKQIRLIESSLISQEDKYRFSEMINCSTGKEKEQLIIYYRLLILVEAVILQYCAN